MRRTKAWINGLFLIVTLGVNTLGAIGVINGLTQKQISDMYPTLITPSPITFSIWSIIYSLLIISVIVMIVRQKDTYYQNVLDQISILFWGSCILNMAWIVSFSYVQIELSVLFIAGLVITLSLICQKLLKLQNGKRWLLPLSFGLYTGWLFIATVVNIAAALVKQNWNGFGIDKETWAIIVLAVAAVLVVVVVLINRNVAFPLPVAWAYFGIHQFLTASEGFNGAYGRLQIVSLIGMIVLIVVAAIQLIRNRFSFLPDASGSGSYPKEPSM